MSVAQAEGSVTAVLWLLKLIISVNSGYFVFNTPIIEAILCRKQRWMSVV